MAYIEWCQKKVLYNYYYYFKLPKQYIYTGNGLIYALCISNLTQQKSGIGTIWTKNTRTVHEK